MTDEVGVAMMDILVKDGYLITMDLEGRIFKRGSVAVEGKVISAVGEGVEGTADTVIDARGKVIMPGLINSHTHLSMTLFRGIANDMPLMQWLEEKIWPLELHLTGEHCYAGALLGCLEMIKSGTTCFADQYFHMGDVARAVEESGLRAALSHGIIEMGDPEKCESDLRDGEKLVKNYQGAADGRITTMFGPHAAYTCSPECLKRVKELAEKYGVGIHIHVAESETEVKDVSEKYGKRPVEHLDSIGFLGPEVLAAHCVWLNEHEIQIIKEREVKPVHNPVSNMKLGSGVAPVPEMLAAGVPVALGTDGAASNNSLDMMNEMKFAALLNKVHKLDPIAISARSALRMATINGARALRLNSEIGSLEVGKKADLVLVDLKRPHFTPLHDIISHLVYSGVGSDVDTVLVDGKILMQGRKVLTINEDEVMRKAQEASEDLLAKGEEIN